MDDGSLFILEIGNLTTGYAYIIKLFFVNIMTFILMFNL